MAALPKKRSAPASLAPATAQTPDRIAQAEGALRGFLDQHRAQHPRGTDDFQGFEQNVMALGLALIRGAIADEMQRHDVQAEAIEIQGRTLRRALLSRQTYVTIAGEVAIERWLFRERTDPDALSVSPLEKRLGIVEGYWTPAAAKQGAWVVSQMTPGKSEELFERVGAMQPSKTSLDRLPKRLSERWEEERKAFEEALQERLEIPAEAVSMAVSLDGVLAPMEGTEPVEKRAEAARQGRICKGPVGYREFSVATLSFCDKKGDMLSAVRFGRAPEAKKVTLKGQLLVEVMNALSKRPDLRVVKLADGAADNWSFLHDLCKERPGTEACLDFFHATEHLHDAVAAVYGESTRETTYHYEGLKETLREEVGGAGKVIRQLGVLARKHPKQKVLARELAYFRNHKNLMRYAELKQSGLPIGSGVVEAACKSLVSQRLKLSGMRWGQQGAQAILTLRGWDQSDRFDDAWALLAATYQCRVHVLAHVIPIKSASR
jgi:hypothetical protein